MANFNFDKVIVGGRLTADPELKQTQSGVSVTSFSIAITKRAKAGEEPKTLFINITAWRSTAELIARYFRKGSSICVVGEHQERSWTDGQGNKRKVLEIVAHEVQFVDSKNEDGSGSAPEFAPPETSTGFTDTDTNEDEALPF